MDLVHTAAICLQILGWWSRKVRQSSAQELLAEPAAAATHGSSCQMRPEKVEQTDLSAEF